jgi:hypothetical protein
VATFLDYLAAEAVIMLLVLRRQPQRHKLDDFDGRSSRGAIARVCRKHSGAPVSIFVAFERNAFTVTKGRNNQVQLVA